MGADDLTSTLIEGESLSGFIEAGAGEESGLVLFLSWEKQGRSAAFDLHSHTVPFIRTPFDEHMKLQRNTKNVSGQRIIPPVLNWGGAENQHGVQAAKG